jgi:hypothetical protein
VGLGLVLATGCRPLAPGAELLNGGFEQPLDFGWRQEAGGDVGSSAIERRRDLGQPDTGCAVRIAQTGVGYARLFQTVSVESDRYQFGFTARLTAGGSPSCGPVAAVILNYMDDQGRVLGSTRWYRPTPGNEEAGTDTSHLVLVADTTAWVRYDLSIRDELAANLPGIRADDVKRLAVELSARVSSAG